MNNKNSIFFALFLLFLCAAAGAETIQLNSEQIVRLSEEITVGRVVNQTVRWNEQKNLIVTDYEIATERRLKGSAKETFTVTVPGGTLDDETHETTLTTLLKLKTRYIFFIENTKQRTLSPFTGSWQGLVREVVDTGGKSYPAPGSGDVVKLGNGSLTFDEFVELLDAYTQTVDPKPLDLTAEFGGASDLPLFAKVYDPTRAAANSTESEKPLDRTAETPPYLPFLKTQPMITEIAKIAETTPAGTNKFRVNNSANLPIVFEALPRAWAWSPNDQFMMSYWNVYQAGLFRVHPTSNGTWAWTNGVFELAGWPPNADMIDQFGMGWGAATLGVTYTRWVPGTIIEADIALNPAFSWTLDNEFATRSNNSSWGFEQTMLHELGHAFGLQHPWETQNLWWDSVMNYAPKPFRFPTIHGDDATAVRTAYPGGTIHDGLVTFYETADDPNDMNPTYIAGNLTPSQIAPNATFSIDDVTLQNVGTDNVVDPVVEIYLTPQRLDWTGAIYLDSRTYSRTIAPYSRFRFQVSNIDVPAGVAPGSYSVGLYLRDTNDGFLGNNSAWSGHGMDLEILAESDLLVSSVGTSQAMMISSQLFAINATILNQGNTLSSRSVLRYFLSTDSAISPSDTLLGTDVVVGLYANSSTAENASFKAPSTVGDYWVGACVDAVSGESDTTNNCSAGVAITVRISRP